MAKPRFSAPANAGPLPMRNLGLFAVLAGIGALAFFVLSTGDQGRSQPTPSSGNGGKPVKIIPGTAGAADWLAVLVEPERIVALPSQVARYSSLDQDPATWGEHPRFDAFTSETIISFDPDLVIVSPYTDQAMVKRVKDAGLRVMMVPGPTSWEEMMSEGRTLAEATGELPTFEEFARELEERRSNLEIMWREPKPKVLPFGSSGNNGSTSGSGTTLDLAITLAGCENTAATLGVNGFSTITDERLLTAS